MNRLAALASALVLAAVVAMPLRATASEPCQAATLEEARALAERAAELLMARGPRHSLVRFADPDGGFIDRDLYVFILDLQGRIWFNAAFPVLPGQSILGSRDRQGRYFVREMVRIASTRGAGWVEYEWVRPCSGEMEPKSTYVIRVGPLIVGVGAYGSLLL